MSKKREVILVASSVIGTATLMYLLPERCCCGMSQQGQISSDNPQNADPITDIDLETDDNDDYHQITAQDCGITSNMTFSQAFAHARAELGRGSVFAWHGKLYNTFYKEEWLAMSVEDRQAFMNSIDFSYVPADDLPPEIRNKHDNHLDNNDLNNNSNHNDSHDDDSHDDDSQDDDSHNDDSHDDDSHDDDSHDEDSHDEDSHNDDSHDDSNRQAIGGDTEGSDDYLVHLPEDPTSVFESHTLPADEPVKPEDLNQLSDNPDFNNHSNTGGMEYFD